MGRYVKKIFTSQSENSSYWKGRIYDFSFAKNWKQSNNTYQLGWNSYCILTLVNNRFSFNDLKSVVDKNNNNIIPEGTYNQIVTRSVSGCTVIVIKCDEKICFMHLDKIPAINEAKTMGILDEFTSQIPHEASTHFYIISSYVEVGKTVGVTLTKEIAKQISEKFPASEVHVKTFSRYNVEEIRQDTDNEGERSDEHLKGHLEFGIVLEESQPVVYWDCYYAVTGVYENYYETLFDEPALVPQPNKVDPEPETIMQFIESIKSDSDSGCCIIQ